MTLHHADCLEAMAAMEPESVDAVVTDPPYGLEFMGKDWDRLGATTEYPDDGEGPWGPTARVRFGRNATTMQAWHQQWAEAAYRVAKPSAYLLAFGGTRTFHRLACAIEDAGWIIRDTLVWGYASGFPKSKASLKPAWEPIVMARKPGPLRDLAIDACRIPGATEPTRFDPERHAHDGYRMDATGAEVAARNDGLGRWPANIVLTDPIFDGGWEGVVGGGEAAGFHTQTDRQFTPSNYFGADKHPGLREGYNDSGTYSRFFQLPRGVTCDWCGASSAGLSSFPPSGPDASAPSRAATAASGESTTTTDSPTTSDTENGSSSSGSATTTRTRSSRGSRPDAPSLSSDPANNAARLGTSSAIIPITASLRLCSSCAADAMPSYMAHGEYGAPPDYARWFLIPKADRADREPVLGGLPKRERRTLNKGLTGVSGDRDGRAERLEQARIREGDDNARLPMFDVATLLTTNDKTAPLEMGASERQNNHPTVKPTDLMRHLVRLVTPAGGTVLDPFLGSGTTALAAEMEGFAWIGIEREEEYVAIAEARLNGTQRGLGLEA